MKKNYIETPRSEKQIKAKPETVAFLLAYSKSLRITRSKDASFETNLN